jgi:hypothetical protein
MRCIGGPLDGQAVSFVGPTLHYQEPGRFNAVAAGSSDLPTMVDVKEHTYIAQRGDSYIHYESLIAPRQRAEAIEALENRLGISPRDLRELHAPAMQARVWTCGDDYCGCSQVEVVGWDAPVVEGGGHADDIYGRGWRKGYRRLWAGPFYTDHEPGAGADLKQLHRYFELAAPGFLQTVRFEGLDA